MKHENKKASKKLSGFYIALCCCVLAIGIVGYLTETKTDNAAPVINTETYETNDNGVFSSDIVSGTDAALSTAKPVIEITQAPAPAEETADEEGETEPEEVAVVEDYAVDNPDIMGNAVTVSSEQPAFILPVIGEILEPYTEVLAYNSALGDWRTHNGVDFAAEKGCSVNSVAQGVVDAVYDNEMGSCVEISHAGGFVTKYMGLDTLEDISEGKEVNSGEVIGTVGDCKGENVTRPHLHFEMIRNGKSLNPTEYLPQE